MEIFKIRGNGMCNKNITFKNNLLFRILEGGVCHKPTNK